MPERNSPCPCGSGKKYKKCCAVTPVVALGAITAVGARPRSDAARLWKLADEIIKSALPEFTEEIAIVARTTLHEVGFDEALLTLLTAFRIPIGERTLAERYVERRGWRLDARDRAAIENHLSARFSIWEVTGIERGRGVHLRDALAGDSLFIHDEAASYSSGLRNYMLGWIVIEGPHAFLYSTHPSVLGPFEGEIAVSRIAGKPHDRERFSLRFLRNPLTTRTMLDVWSREADERDRRYEQGPRLQNTSGDPVLLTEDSFIFSEKDRDEVVRRLRGIRGAGEVEISNDLIVIPFTHSRPDDRERPTIIGHIDLRAGESKFVAATNSRRRASALRKKIERALEGLAKHHLRVHTDPRSSAFEDDDRELPEETPEVAAIVRAEKERHYERWIDEFIPLLNMTPRMAMRSEEKKGQLRTLLKMIEAGEANASPESRYDVKILYRALGLNYE